MTHMQSNPSINQCVDNEQSTVSKSMYWIEGLFCGNCASALERKVSAMRTVDSASVNFTYSYMIIDYIGGVKALSAIEHSVKKLGYKITSGSLAVRQQQLVQQTKQAYSTFFFAFIFSMWSMLSAVVTYLHGPNELSADTLYLLNIFSGIFSIPVVFAAGFHFHKMAWYAFKGRLFTIDVLISTSALLAFFVSCYFLWWQIDIVYFDTACMLILLHLLGRTVDLNTKTKAMACLKDEIALNQKDSVLREKNTDQIESISVNDVVVGDVLVLHLGEVIPVDCELISKSALCDNSINTGESTPVHYLKDSKLNAGYVNLGQTIHVKATCAAGNSAADYQLTSILMKKAKQINNSHKINEFAAKLSKVIFVFSFLAGVYVYIIYGDWQLAFERMLCVLVIACPCSLTIAAPLASLILNQQSIKKNIVINNYAVFANSKNITAFYFDKTGTLTQGKPSLSSIKVVNEKYTLEQLLQYSYQCVYYSGHIYSNLIHQYINECISPHREQGSYQETLGYGIEWVSKEGDLCIALGSKKWFVQQHIDININENNTTSYLVINNELVAVFEFEDGIKSTAKQAINELTYQVPYIAMLSGDNKESCQYTAKQLGIDSRRVYSAMSPEQKQKQITIKQQTSQIVGFIGDGLNDNLALMQADIGIATKSANALTKMSATVCLLTDDLTKVKCLKPLANLYYKLLRYNFIYAVAYNMIAIPIALLGSVSPLIAVSAMLASSLSVSLNSVFFSKRMDRI